MFKHKTKTLQDDAYALGGANEDKGGNPLYEEVDDNPYRTGGAGGRGGNPLYDSDGDENV